MLGLDDDEDPGRDALADGEIDDAWVAARLPSYIKNAIAFATTSIPPAAVVVGTTA